MKQHPARCFTRALVFTRAACTYWLGIWPSLNVELRRWRTQAERIPDKTLRIIALQALAAKRGNLEGAAAFATLSTRAWRQESAQAMVAYQVIFDYLDCLCEQPNPDPIAYGHQINQALLRAVKPGVDHADYYALYRSNCDGGYLTKLVDRCRETLIRLPSYTYVSIALDRATRRIATYQSLNHGDALGSHEALASWTRYQAIRREHENGQLLNWWEIAASCGSSLGSFALIALATRQAIDPQEVQAIEQAYFPWIGATNSLLDSLIDQTEDAAPGQHRLLDYYVSPQQATDRLEFIVREAAHHASQLPPRHGHTLMLAAMVGFYLTDPQADDPSVSAIRERAESGITEFAFPVRVVMRLRRIAARPQPSLANPPLH
jgi:tetraprenyl-beta-curcumene synthase